MPTSLSDTVCKSLNRRKEIFHLIFDIWHLTLEESGSAETQSTSGDFSGNDKYQFSNIK
jgi:hypothetical protein